MSVKRTDKKVFLSCHLLVEFSEPLSVYSILPLVPSRYSPGSVEVEHALGIVLKFFVTICTVQQCQTKTNLGHESPISHLVPKISFRRAQGCPSRSRLTTVLECCL